MPLKYITDELFNDEIYFFRVFAINEIGKSEPSNTCEVVTLFDDKLNNEIDLAKNFNMEILPLDIPSNICVKIDNNNRVELSWDSVDRAALYGIERRNIYDDKKMWLEIANTDRTKFTDRSIIITGEYVYRLTAKLPGVINSDKSPETLPIFIVPTRQSITSTSPFKKNVISESQLNNTYQKSESITSLTDSLLSDKSIENKKTKTKKLDINKQLSVETIEKKDEIDEITKIELEPNLITNYTINEGESAELTIIWKGIVDECLWFKDTNLLPNLLYTFEFNRSIYWLKDAKESDSGNYKCELKNIDTNDIVTHNIKVIVNSKC